MAVTVGTTAPVNNGALASGQLPDWTNAVDLDVGNAGFGMVVGAKSQAVNHHGGVRDGPCIGVLARVRRQRFVVQSHHSGNTIGHLYGHSDRDFR